MIRWVSLPLRGAWIEINDVRCYCPLCRSLPLRGAWIEIGIPAPGRVRYLGRSPYGERGLKSILGGVPVGIVWSLPSRGAWIEMLAISKGMQRMAVAPLTGSVD